MASKYDRYWKNKMGQVSGLLAQAAAGKSTPLDVSDIQPYGRRKSWYGMVIISGDSIEKAHMAHAKSLGRMILDKGLLTQYQGMRFKLVIAVDHKITAMRFP